MRVKEPILDERKLSKKYRTNVNNLIRWWKAGKSDVEIASSTGVDAFTLKQIKSEIEIAHRRHRLEEKKEALGYDQSSNKRQIFLRPFI